MQDDNTNDNQSVDDALEESRDSTTENVGNNPLPQEGNTPAGPPTDMPDDDLPIDHPSIDSNFDSTEAYQEGEDENDEANPA